MASRMFDRMMCLGRARVMIRGSFRPNGAATAVLGKKGNGYSVTHTPGANTYTIVLEDQYMDYDSCWIQAQSASLGQEAQLTVEPNMATRTLVVGLFDSGSKAAVNDAAADPNLRIHFGICLKNTSGNF